MCGRGELFGLALLGVLQRRVVVHGSISLLSERVLAAVVLGSVRHGEFRPQINLLPGLRLVFRVIKLTCAPMFQVHLLGQAQVFGLDGLFEALDLARNIEALDGLAHVPTEGHLGLGAELVELLRLLRWCHGEGVVGRAHFRVAVGVLVRRQSLWQLVHIGCRCRRPLPSLD